MPAPPSVDVASSGEKKAVSDAKVTDHGVKSSEVDEAYTAQSRDAHTMVGDASLAEVPTRTPMNMPVQQRPAKYYSKRFDDPGMQHNNFTYVPHEGDTLNIDQLPQNMQKTFDGIQGEDLSQLGVLDHHQAVLFQKTLTDAGNVYQSHEIAQQQRRASFLSDMKILRESELRHEKQIRLQQDSFTRTMMESLKMTGDEKEAAQRKAIGNIKMATEESHLAADRRARLEHTREQLAVLDDLRVIAATRYAVAIQKVVTKAIGGVKAKSNKDALPAKAQHAIQQSVFEQHPEMEHQSIDEVLCSVEIPKEPVVLGQSETKNIDKVSDNQVKPQQKPANNPSTTPQPRGSKQSNKKGKSIDQEPRSKPINTMTEAQNPSSTSKPEEMHHSATAHSNVSQSGVNQSNNKGQATAKEVKPKPSERASDTQDAASVSSSPSQRVAQQPKGRHVKKKKSSTGGQDQKMMPQQVSNRAQERTAKLAAPASETPESKLALRTSAAAAPGLKAETKQPAPKTEDLATRPQETPAVASAKIYQPLQASVMNVPTADGNEKMLAVTINGSTITDKAYVETLLRQDQEARKDSVAVDVASSGVKKENDVKGKGKDAVKEGDSVKAKIDTETPGPETYSDALKSSLAEANSPASIQPAKNKKKKNKNKKKTGGNGGEGSIGGSDGKPSSGAQTPAAGEGHKGG